MNGATATNNLLLLSACFLFRLGGGVINVSGLAGVTMSSLDGDLWGTTRAGTEARKENSRMPGIGEGIVQLPYGEWEGASWNRDRLQLYVTPVPALSLSLSLRLLLCAVHNTQL